MQSTFQGAGYGLCAAFIALPAWPAAALVGAINGLLFSPVYARLCWRIRFTDIANWVAGPTTLVCFLGGSVAFAVAYGGYLNLAAIALAGTIVVSTATWLGMARTRSRTIRRKIRAVVENACPECGYPLVGLTTNRCPECGTAQTPHAAP
ncbi:MAG: hypothetical protein H6810_01305 [Phycisphaeraceae bacterium]|nr:MAG: hypothetical protein H6810_01305 [Phycisphaeraceae bacterium]